MLIWLRTPTGQLGVPDGIVRREELEQLLDAQALRRQFEAENEQALETARQQAQYEIHAAQQEAARLIEQAQAQAEQLRQQGYKEGMRQAMQEWHDRQAASAMDQSRAMREMHVRLADVVTHAVERIVRSEDRSALYQRALRNVQSLTRGASSLKLRVCPQDYEHAQASIGSIGDLHQAGLQVEVLSDAGLRAGSCIFESEMGVLDASLETQLDGLRSAMQRAVQRAVAAEDEAAAQAQATQEAHASEAQAGAQGQYAQDGYAQPPHAQGEYPESEYATEPQYDDDDDDVDEDEDEDEDEDADDDDEMLYHPGEAPA